MDMRLHAKAGLTLTDPTGDCKSLSGIEPSEHVSPLKGYQVAMSEQRRRPGTSARELPISRQGGSQTRAPKSAGILPEMSAHLGNHEMNARLQAATQKRDGLLGFITERLGSMHGLQSRELRSIGQRDQWKHEVALGKDGFSLPQPTRWREAAGLYRAAAAAICGGNLSRGADLLRRAMKAERVALESYPEFLGGKKTPEEDLRAGPASIEGIETGEGCPVTSLPAGIELAERIIRVGETTDPVAARHLYSPHEGWWADEELDEEKKDEKANKANKPKSSDADGARQADKKSPSTEALSSGQARRKDPSDHAQDQDELLARAGFSNERELAEPSRGSPQTQPGEDTTSPDPLTDLVTDIKPYKNKKKSP